jgi:hypothetical protein
VRVHSIILGVLAVLFLSQPCLFAQDSDALLKQELRKLPTELEQMRQAQQTPALMSDTAALAQLGRELQALKQEVARLAAQQTQSAQSAVTEADLVRFVEIIEALKAELAALQTNNTENQKLLVSLDNEGFHTAPSISAERPESEQSFLPGFSLAGFVDASNYTNHNTRESSFGLDQVEIDLVKDFSDQASLRADIEYVNDGQGGFGFDLEQGYMAWNTGGNWKWQFTFGKFNAPIGYESADPTGMYQYSFGLVSSYCLPGNLTGVMVSLADPKLVSWSLYAVNGWDVNTDNNKDKTVGTHFRFNPQSNLTFGVSAITGPELDNNNSSRRTVVDCDLTYNPLPVWLVGAEFNTGWESKVLADNGTAQWSGILLMSNVQFAQRYGITARLDYLNDRDGSRTSTPQELKAFCLSPSIKIVDGLTGLFEVRYDWSNRGTFARGNGVVRSNQVSTAFEFTYGF